MRRAHRLLWICIPGCLLFVIACTVAYRHWMTKKGPRLQFDHTYYNAGSVHTPEEVTLRHSFPFGNSGDRILTITRVRTTCGCAVVSLRQMKKEYMPGEEGVIEAELTLGQLGPRSSDIVVWSNASNSPTTLAFEGAFYPKAYAATVPKELNFEECVVGHLADKTLTVSVLATEPTEIGAHAHAEQGNVSIIPSDTCRLEHRSLLGYYVTYYSFKVKPAAQASGHFRDTIRIELSPSVVTSIDVRVEGTIVPEWCSIPEKALLIFSGDGEQQGELPCQVFWIRNRRGQGFSIKTIDNPFAQWLKVTTERNGDDGTAVVVCSAIAIPSAKSLSGTIRIVLDSGEEAIVDIGIVAKR